MKLKDGDIIVFAGDSTTDADKTTMADGLGNGYVKLVSDALYAFMPKENYRIVNAGICGNTSLQLLERWERDVMSLAPDVVFCMIGINDVWRHFNRSEPFQKKISVTEYADNLSAICEKVKGVRIFCIMPPYFMERNRTDEMRVMTEEYAAAAREVAKKYRADVLDVQPAFDEYMLGRSGQTISWDRVHPGWIGSQLIMREIFRYLEVKLS